MSRSSFLSVIVLGVARTFEGKDKKGQLMLLFMLVLVSISTSEV